MSLKLTVDDEIVLFDQRRFPAGETYLKLPQSDEGFYASIEMDFEGNDDLFNLALMVDCLRRQYSAKLPITLVMKYLPYARQDRVCSEGESLSVKIVCDFINSLWLSKVVCYNIHSDVGAALLNNLEHHDSVSVCWRLPYYATAADTVLVSPDAGANKKVLAVAKKYGYNEVVRADKTRDVASGKITGTAVYSEHVGDKDFLIVDDICDGGRTFTELAKELRKLTTGKVMLYVTHGIFSAGTEVFDGLVDTLYTSNPVGATGKAAVASGKVVVI